MGHLVEPPWFPVKGFDCLGSVCTETQLDSFLFSFFSGGKLASGVHVASPVGLACRPEMLSAPTYSPERWMRLLSWLMSCAITPSPAQCKPATVSIAPQPGTLHNGRWWVPKLLSTVVSLVAMTLDLRTLSQYSLNGHPISISHFLALLQPSSDIDL